MKRWAILVVLLYFLILVGLTVPLGLVALYPEATLQGMVEAYSEWLYWVFVVLMVAQGERTARGKVVSPGASPLGGCGRNFRRPGQGVSSRRNRRDFSPAERPARSATGRYP